MINDTEDKIYNLEDVDDCLKRADKRDGINENNIDDVFKESIKEFINCFSLFCSFKDKTYFNKKKQ